MLDGTALLRIKAFEIGGTIRHVHIVQVVD